ncbi:unnamed protein product [Rotaria sordida]|uniref:polynucleotide adenylyltransferase n=1 Tax=Rotaria sordida TaxID=392033 RepID=A0A819JQF1_9BILA|nr:unnamed protein product [Rotaria sordida]
MDDKNNTTKTTTIITDQLNSLRSILQSDDYLLIQPSGDYEQVRIKLDHDIQISFLFDSLNILNKSLTINNVHHLRIKKSSDKCQLNNEQWTNIRKYFDELIQNQNESSSLLSIAQSIQDHLLKNIMTNQTCKQKTKKPMETTVVEDVSAMSNKFRGADLIFNRIQHDKLIDRSQVIIGYEDRFIGIHEIAFNEFKKVHEHKYGVPMHRIRYFKINGCIIWDRTRKLDILTGSEQQNGTLYDTEERPILVQGLYHFDQSLQQWIIQYPHITLTSDDLKIPSTNDTCLPEGCHIVTWNILFDFYQSTLIYTSQRYRSILDTLKSLLPDIICLQEVTYNFLNLLLNEIWLQENNYYIIIMKNVIDSYKEKSYGQLMIMKNFRPRSFSICPLDLSDNDEETAAPTTVTKHKITKELIIARFGLNTKATIDLVNLHLHSDLSRNASGKRCQTLENLFKKMKTINYMLIGDFNFGDNNLKEQNILASYENKVHDLWKDVYNLNQNPGYTYDPSTNICAHITSQSQINRRLDRYLIHTLDNLSYSIEHLSMIGIEKIPIDLLNIDNNQLINQSDHYALQLIINFRTRSIKYYPSDDGLWPSHINLLWPFFDLIDCQNDQEDILLRLRLLLSQQPSFSIKINEIDSFIENNIIYMKMNDESTKYVKQLQEQLIKLFPQCLRDKRSSCYNPHMTIGQFDNEEKFNEAKSSLILHESFEFPVEYIYVLQRPHDNDTTPFHITYQLPLGPILQPINFKQINSVHIKLQEFFQTMNLYETNQSYKRKQEKFEKLSSCFQQMFNKDTLHCFTTSFLPYGSFRIGINGQDLDTVFVINELKLTNNKTSFDESLLQLKHDSNALKNYIVNLLETQINGNLKHEIAYYRKVQALFPIISILFKDQTKVHDIERLVTYTRCPSIFQHLLTFIRTWAQHVGLYEQVYGYLGGYSWAILCAYICHTYLPSMKSLSSIEQFSIDELFSLVRQFFSTFANFNWSSQAFRLYPKSYKQMNLLEKSSVHNRGSMRIISPSPPYNNTGRATINSTRDLIIQGFQCVLQLLNTINTISSEDKLNALKQILELNNDFPNEKVKSLVQLTFSSENSNELDEWIGWMKSRLAHFVNACEVECHLVIQTQSSIEYKSNNTEALYSIGFQLDPQTLIQHQNFSSCLKKFVDQFDLYPNRKESMKISYKIFSIHDWKLERMQAKLQRTTK